MKSASFPMTKVLMLLVVPLQGAFVAAPSPCLAWDGAMLCAWHRTWHAPSPLDTPLRDYYIPRTPGQCDREVYSDGSGCAEFGGCAMPACDRWQGVPHAAGYACGPHCGFGLESPQVERLGQIPNDVELSLGGAPAGAGR